MFNRRGQSIIEYTMIIGIVTAALYYMGPGIKRGVQSLIKLTADQVGNQENADQDFNDTQEGYMNSSITQTQDSNNKQVLESGYIPQSGNAIYGTTILSNEYSDTISNVQTNGGFTATTSGQ